MLCAASVALLRASGPTFWTTATAADFLRGTSDGVYVSLSGVVTAGPDLTSRLTSTPAQIWSLAASSDGTLWAGTGGDGRVIRARAGQAEQTVFDSSENNVFAIALHGSRTYAATSPDGRVYAIEGDGSARTFFDPQEKYIWALHVDAAGRVWVGAGNPAVIYRVDAAGTSEVAYRPPAGHVVTLASDAAGRVLAGTESPGRLYRLDAADRPFVLLDAGLTELRAVTNGRNGVVFAAAVARGEDAASGGETTSVAVTLSASTGTPAGDTPGATADSGSTRRSALFRIDPNGTWETVWTTADVIYDIAATPDGVLVATGPAGRLYRIDDNRDVSLLTGVDARQVTRFVTTSPSGGLQAFATANPGRVLAVGSGQQSPATYVSSVRDSRSAATWGLIRWEAGSGVTLSTRSGNTDKPDDSWSDWSPPYTRAVGEPILSPAARFLQWRAVFTTPASGPAPSLTAVTVAYLTANSRPVLTAVTVHPPGVVFQRPFTNEEGAIAGLDEATADARRPPGDTGPPTPAPGRRMFQRGLQTIAWRAEDADEGDRLTYTLEYRREGLSDWRVLRANLTDNIYVWDTTSAVDGRYVVRVRASDSPSNAGDRALTGERESDAIEVDNTPPTVTTTVAGQGTNRRLMIHVVDTRSPIQKVEYSVVGGPWLLLYPADGLADAPDERYELTLAAGMEPGQIVVRATDLHQNTTAQAAATTGP